MIIGAHHNQLVESRNTFRIGSEDINVITAIRSFGKTNCPFGLFISEQTWKNEEKKNMEEKKMSANVMALQLQMVNIHL